MAASTRASGGAMKAVNMNEDEQLQNRRGPVDFRKKPL
jgi:hypothetical protein